MKTVLERATTGRALVRVIDENKAARTKPAKDGNPSQALLCRDAAVWWEYTAQHKHVQLAECGM